MAIAAFSLGSGWVLEAMARMAIAAFSWHGLGALPAALAPEWCGGSSSWIGLVSSRCFASDRLPDTRQPEPQLELGLACWIGLRLEAGFGWGGSGPLACRSRGTTCPLVASALALGWSGLAGLVSVIAALGALGQPSTKPLLAHSAIGMNGMLFYGGFDAGQTSRGQESGT